MLTSLKIKGFKSLRDVAIDFKPFTVLFGPNTAGKSNVVEAIQVLSRMANVPIAQVLGLPIRGYPIEMFSFPPTGLAGLLEQTSAWFNIDVTVILNFIMYRYRAEIAIIPQSGRLLITNESFEEEKNGKTIEKFKILTNHDKSAFVATRSWQYFREDDSVGDALRGFSSYNPDPRVAMRNAFSPMDVDDIGDNGEVLAPFLYRLSQQREKEFTALKRTLSVLVPGVEDVIVDLDKRRGTLDIMVKQDGIEYSSRVLSEGTLRVLALCAIAVNPWAGSLIALEEPENGVHPRRLELIAQLLGGLVSRGKQVVATTHSPLFCQSVLKLAREPEFKGKVALVQLRMGRNGTEAVPLDLDGPLFTDGDIAKALADCADEVRFEDLMLRGLLDD